MKTFAKLPKVVLAADFETTTNDPSHVEVWSAESIEVSSSVPADSAHCHHQTNIKDFVEYLETLAGYGADIIVYFHNLKFDGSYLLDYFNRTKKYNLFSYTDNDDNERLLDMDKIIKKNKMKAHEYTYMISDTNVIYSIVLATKAGHIEFRDSAKLLPFSLRDIARDFQTPHKKLEMNYGDKQPGYTPTAKEMKYIENDVFVLKEALETLSSLAGCLPSQLPLTIGAMALKEFKRLFDAQYGYDMPNGEAWNYYFPNQAYKIPNSIEDLTFDGYIRKSYRGGWCYVSPKWKGKVITQQAVIDYFDRIGKPYGKMFRKKVNSIGFVYDVNSLYPSVMGSISGCFYPYGQGTYETGDFSDAQKKDLKDGELYGFMHVKFMFHVKHNHLPCIQLKGDFNYKGTEWLETSDIYLRKHDMTVAHQVDTYLTYEDWILINEQYDVSNVEVVSHITFETVKGIFDAYINKWASIKQSSKGAKRQFAKLMLNNIYGKFSTSPIASYMVCHYDGTTKKVIRTPALLIDAKRAVYIPIGSAITSWARNFTIRHAQENYDIFVYADTDSIHCIGDKSLAKGIHEHPTALCCWKNETDWQSAIFAGQKRYIERVTAEDGKPISKWYYNVKCCGMSDGAKKHVKDDLHAKRMHLADFKQGLIVPGVLKGHVVSGGIFLQEQNFEFH